MPLESCTRTAPNSGAEYQHRLCRSACALSEEVISRIRISDIWVALGGARPRFKRAPAFWRNTQDRNVALDDAKGTWFDHARGEGGGVLDLIRHVRGGSRAEALRWLSEYVGIPFRDQSLTPAERRHFAEQRQALEREWRDCVAFRFAAEQIADELLQQRELDYLSRAAISGLLAAVRTEAGLRAEYGAWLERWPELTAALVSAGRRSDARMQRALAAIIAAEAGGQ